MTNYIVYVSIPTVVAVEVNADTATEAKESALDTVNGIDLCTSCSGFGTAWSRMSEDDHSVICITDGNGNEVETGDGS